MIKKYLQEGFELKRKGYYKHSIESFYKVLELDNSCEEVLLEIAESYYLINDEERAFSYIEQILTKNPLHVDSLKLLQKIFIDKKALNEAIKSAKNIYIIEPSLNNLIQLLKLLIENQNYEEIFEYKDFESEYEILYLKALALFCLKDFENAEILIDKTLSENEENKNLLLKGKILYNTNRQEECINLINKINLNTASAEIFNFVGLVIQYECNFEDAIKHFLSAIKLDSSNDVYFYNCASTYFKMGNNELAKKYYNLAISLAPEKEHYHFALANLYYSEKHYKRALEELNSELFEAKLLKAVILHDAGYYAIAKKEFEKLEIKEPNNELINAYKNNIKEKLKI